MKLELDLIGEGADRFNEFISFCDQQGISVNKRLNDLILGDILMAEKLSEYAHGIKGKF